MYWKLASTAVKPLSVIVRVSVPAPPSIFKDAFAALVLLIAAMVDEIASLPPPRL